MEKPRIGVYICHCGTNISKMVDVEAIAEEFGDLPNVVVSKHYRYMCSDPGQELIIQDIKENLRRSLGCNHTISSLFMGNIFDFPQ